MSQCVPSWELDENPTPPKLNLTPQPNFISDVPSLELDYEVAELTWENGQITMHGLGPPRTWEKPRASGTLESIVNQATLLPHQKTTLDGSFDLVPCYDHHHPTTATACATATVSMDALVPSSGNMNGSDAGTCGVGCSTRVGSCSEMMARADQSVSGSATYSRQLTLDTFEVGLGVGGFTSTSLGSPGNTSSGMKPTMSLTNDDHDSVCHSRHQREAGDEADKKKGKGKYSVSTKRSRAAAIHNQSERKRRDKINERMKTLQKLVPNSNKTDKASMLDEVIEYLKQMQAQIHMMSRMNMSPMMLPLALQQQLQMSMMAPMMNMGMGMGVMDINSMARPNIHAIPPVLPPAAFMPLAPWEAHGDRLPTAMPDPLSTFLACQSQPMNMDTYTRMAALYQQLHQAPGPSSKN